jgi:hypothetical protein
MIRGNRTFSIAGSVQIILPGHGQGKGTELLRILQEQGFILTLSMHGDFLLCIDHNESAYKKFIKSGGDARRSILLRLEPESVFPSQYTPKIEKKYGKIFSPGRIDQARDSWIGWPYKFAADPNLPKSNEIEFDQYLADRMRDGTFEFSNWAKRKTLISMVAANKVSPIKQENYKLRRTLAREMPKSHIQVYGLLWNDSIAAKLRHRLAVSIFNLRQGVFPNFLSIYGGLFTRFDPSFKKIDDKHSVLRESKFTIVIENCNSYSSEKLIDALINGCVPLYVGPKLRDIGLSEDIAIQISGNKEEILNITKSIGEDEIRSYLNSTVRLLNDVSFRNNWTDRPVYQGIAKKIYDFLINQ